MSLMSLLFGDRQPLARHYGVDTPRAAEAVNRLDVRYRIEGLGSDGCEYRIGWDLLTNEERLELDRLLWKSRLVERDRARRLHSVKSSDDHQ